MRFRDVPVCVCVCALFVCACAYCVYWLGGHAVNNLKMLFDGLTAVGAVYCLAALIRIIGGM